MAVPLIARAGIWRSKEQYLATIYLLLPVQLLWLNAMYEGTADLMKDPGWLAQQERRNDDDKGVRIRRMFTHGPGGSGKTYFSHKKKRKPSPHTIVRQDFCTDPLCIRLER